jgi:hypothetical protein|tara:strand:- start:1447 stop:1746 length:300 start_codon:yes stop_codon:yes gene_type:complete
MFIVTEEAKKEFKRIRESKTMDPGKHLRFAIPPVWTGEGSFGIVIDEERDGDIAIFLDDDKVLIIEDSVSEGVDNQKEKGLDSILDFVESPEGTRFTLS